MDTETKPVAVPRAALWLGASGAIPFVALAILSVPATGLVREEALFALAAYGAVILSFLGGIQWGLAIAPGHGDGAASARHDGLALSVAPALIGWLALLLPRDAGFVALAAAFAAVLYVDLRATRRAQAPSWYPRLRWPLTLTVVAALVLAAVPARAADQPAEAVAAWAALRAGGHVALLRHATAPGTGDPAGFTLGDCSTQRTLSDDGRAQARRIGERFRANGIDDAGVYSSQWCRCLETAELLALGPVRELAALNSFFGRSEREAPQMRALRRWMSDRNLGGVTVLVTHQVNITALTGVFPRSGELVIVRPSDTGEVTLVGTIETR